MFEWFILALFAAAGLFLLVTSAHLFRGAEIGRGVLTLVFGLGVLAATLFAVFPALTDTRLVALTAAHDKLKAETTDLQRDVRIAGQRRADAERLADRTLTTFEQEVGHLRGMVRGSATTLSADLREREPVEGGNPGPVDRLNRTIADIRDLHSLRAKSVPSEPRPIEVRPAEPARTDATRDLMRLRDKMGARLETEHYNVEVYPDRELIGGRNGRYYVVDLKNAASGVRYYFEGGRYTLSQANAEFRASLNTFIGDVLKKMDGQVRYDLFVRGSADAKPYAGRFETGHEYQRISYLKALGGGRYSTAQASTDQGPTVRNEDLPNLRAAFLAKLIGDIYPVKPPVVLEGSVSPTTNDRDRNAEIILYVDW